MHGQQEGAAYNGHFECVCYHPLFLVRVAAATLRPGCIVWLAGILEPVVKGYQKKGLTKPELYGIWNKERFAIRLPANQVIQEQIQPLALLNGHPGSL